MHSRVFLNIDSFMVHDNPRPRSQSQKSKIDGCLETDLNSISIRDKPDAFFRAGKMHLPVAFYRRLSWALPVSRNLRLYAIFIKESHRNTSMNPKIKLAFWQHSRKGHSRETHARIHFRGLD